MKLPLPPYKTLVDMDSKGEYYHLKISEDPLEFLVAPQGLWTPLIA